MDVQNNHKKQWTFDWIKLKQLRNQRRFTRLKVANSLGNTSETLRQWEIGEYAPRTSDLAALASLYKVSPSRFFKKESAHAVPTVSWSCDS